MADENFKKFGSLIGDVIVHLYIYFFIAIIAVLFLVILVIVYMKKRKKDKENGSSDYKENKKYIIMRIAIIIFSGVLVLILSPILLGFLL